MSGIELLGRSKAYAPDAKLVLLTAYADTDVAIRAINEIGLDHYLMKPWAPPEERLYPVLDDLLDQWDRENADRFDGVRVVGNRWSERSYDTRMFLARNHVPYRWLEIERDEDARRLLALFGGTDPELPLVLLPDGEVLRGAGPARDRRRPRLAHERTVDPLRPRRDRRRPGRAGGGGVRRIGGPPHGGHRARCAGRPGGPECAHRELPRVPERPQRCRPVAPRGDPGTASRRRDDPGPRRGRSRAARPGARGPFRRRHRDRREGGA